MHGLEVDCDCVPFIYTVRWRHGYGRAMALVNTLTGFVMLAFGRCVIWETQFAKGLRSAGLNKRWEGWEVGSVDRWRLLNIISDFVDKEYYLFH
jgi:hypothetical protein